MNQRFTVHLPCPYPKSNGKGHCTGETLADGRAKVTISVCCPKCQSIYEADLWTMKTTPSKAQRRMGRHQETTI